MEQGMLSDTELLYRFRESGDREALGELFTRHSGLAYRVALAVLGNTADAEDAAQQTFLTLVRYAPKVHGHGSLTALIARMALRQAQDSARSRGRRHARETAWFTEQAAAGMDSELQEVVRDGIGQLGDTYRLPVLLHYYFQLSTEETAAALGISPNAARTRLSRAVSRLRDNLQQRGHVLAIPALLVLLVPQRNIAAPAHLATTAQMMASTASLPAAGGLGMLLVSSLTVKLTTAALVVGIAVAGSVMLQLCGPTPRTAAVVTRAPQHIMGGLVKGEPVSEQDALVLRQGLTASPGPRLFPPMTSEPFLLAQAQPPATAREAKPPANVAGVRDPAVEPLLVRDVTFAGLTHALPDVQSVRQLIGKPYTAETARSEQTALVNLGYFSKVDVETQPMTDGLRVRFNVVEHPPVLHVMLVVKERVIEQDILDEVDRLAVQPLSGQPFSQPALDKSKGALELSGWFYRVEMRNTQGQDGVDITIELQPNPVIRQLSFKGSNRFTQNEFREIVAMPMDHTMNQNTVVAAASKIREAYATQGYTLTQVVDIAFTDGNLTFTIFEPTISEIRVEGNKRLTEDVIRQAITCKVGEAYNEKRIQASIRQIGELPGVREIRAFPQPDPANGTLLLVFRIEENARVTPMPSISEIRIEGNRKVSEAIIRQAITCKVGEAFDKHTEESVRQVDELPGIESVKVFPQPVLATGTIVLVFQVEEEAAE